jgi:hypothetical protein
MKKLIFENSCGDRIEIPQNEIKIGGVFYDHNGVAVRCTECGLSPQQRIYDFFENGIWQSYALFWKSQNMPDDVDCFLYVPVKDR